MRHSISQLWLRYQKQQLTVMQFESQNQNQKQAIRSVLRRLSFGLHAEFATIIAHMNANQSFQNSYLYKTNLHSEFLLEKLKKQKLQLCTKIIVHYNSVLQVLYAASNQILFKFFFISLFGLDRLLFPIFLFEPIIVRRS